MSHYVFPETSLPFISQCVLVHFGQHCLSTSTITSLEVPIKYLVRQRFNGFLIDFCRKRILYIYIYIDRYRETTSKVIFRKITKECPL